MHLSTFFFLILAVFILPEVIHSVAFLAGPINLFCGNEAITLDKFKAAVQQSAKAGETAEKKAVKQVQGKPVKRRAEKAAKQTCKIIKAQVQNIKYELTDSGLVLTVVDGNIMCGRDLVNELTTPKDLKPYLHVEKAEWESKQDVVIVTCKNRRVVTVYFYETEEIAQSKVKSRPVSLVTDDEKEEKEKKDVEVQKLEVSDVSLDG